MADTATRAQGSGRLGSALPGADTAEHKRVQRSADDEAALSARKLPGYRKLGGDRRRRSRQGEHRAPQQDAVPYEEAADIFHISLS